MVPNFFGQVDMVGSELKPVIRMTIPASDGFCRASN